MFFSVSLGVFLWSLVFGFCLYVNMYLLWIDWNFIMCCRYFIGSFFYVVFGMGINVGVFLIGLFFCICWWEFLWVIGMICKFGSILFVGVVVVCFGMGIWYLWGDGWFLVVLCLIGLGKWMFFRLVCVLVFSLILIVDFLVFCFLLSCLLKFVRVNFFFEVKFLKGLRLWMICVLRMWLRWWFFLGFGRFGLISLGMVGEGVWWVVVCSEIFFCLD